MIADNAPDFYRQQDELTRQFNQQQRAEPTRAAIGWLDFFKLNEVAIQLDLSIAGGPPFATLKAMAK